MPTLRSVVFRFADFTALSDALADAHGSLPLPEGESIVDGEWVLAIFEIGSRKRATAAAARGVRAAGDTHLAFERRDWERLQQFVNARSEHMRAAKPSPASVSRIPAAPPMESAPASSIPPMSEVPPSAALASSRAPLSARILLVDDDTSTRDAVRAMLADIGLEVVVVGTADEARRSMDGHDFDALVLDFHAPGTGPLQFVRVLRKDPRWTGLPVLFLSHRPSSRDVVEAFASGADDFLPKPFRAPELGARVFGLLRRARLARSAPTEGEKGPA